MSESSLLRHIAARSADLAQVYGEVVVGPGDDCAVVRSPAGDELLLTVDQVIEGRHWDPAVDEDPGAAGVELPARKAIARSVSDIAAMGGRPVWALATGLLPDGFTDGDALFDAMSRWARHWGCPLIGGDIAFGPGPLSLTVTVAGRMSERALPVRRSGARIGDALYLTGQIGGSLASGWHARFEPRLDAGEAIARSGAASAMIDLSDGLGRDAARVGEASGARLVIETSRLPLSHHCAGWLDAVSEGEDYELLVALEPRAVVETSPALIGPIGTVGPGSPGAVFVDAYGVEHDARNLGWDHGVS